jgi:hypothetical protein
MSDTPETNKLLADWLKGRSEKIPDFAALARRLERERDAARDQVEELTAVIKGLRAIMRQEAAK